MLQILKNAKITAKKVDNMEIIVNKNPKTENYFEEFSKKWEIATSRLKPHLNEIAKEKHNKINNQRFRHDSSSFTYLGGCKK